MTPISHLLNIFKVRVRIFVKLTSYLLTYATLHAFENIQMYSDKNYNIQYIYIYNRIMHSYWPQLLATVN